MKCPIKNKVILVIGLASVVVSSVNLLGISLNIFLFLLIFLTIARKAKQSIIAKEPLLDANKELETKVQECTFELTQVTQKLLAMQAEVDKALEIQRELHLFKSQIISTISHEYRTPLTTILSSAELLQNYGHQWTEQKKLQHLSRIQSTTKYMSHLVDDMLFIGITEANKMQFNLSKLNLKEFCQELVEQITCDLSREVAQIKFDYQGIYDNFYLDEKLLRYILTHLLSNAIKYSPSSSIVSFKVKYADSLAWFSIQDFGIGIPEADVPRIFECFYRGSNVGTIEGTGLGLTIAKKCVELHKGHICVESVLNKGTIFTVTLPCTQGTVHKCLVEQFFETPLIGKVSCGNNIS